MERRSNNGFDGIKDDIADAVLFVHLSPTAQLTLTTNTSEIRVGAVLHQVHDGNVQRLGLYSKKLTDAHKKNTAQITKSLSIKHFRFQLVGRSFIIYADQTDYFCI